MRNVLALRAAAVLVLAAIAPLCAANESSLDVLPSTESGIPAPANGRAHEALAFADRPAVAAGILATMRGGFSGKVGGELLEMSFGIERVVSLNGEIVAATRFQVPDLRVNSSQTASLLQSGAGNHVAADIARNLPLQVIQNTLDNQVLRQVTTIDAHVRNLELFRAVQFGATLNRQLLMSVH